MMYFVTTVLMLKLNFLEDLFEKYCSKFKYIRELFVFQDTVKQILEAIKKKKKLKLKYGAKLTTVEPYFIKRDEQGDENFLFCYCETEKKYHNYKLKDLEVVSILDEKIKGKDKKYIENVRKNFDPFLGNRKFYKSETYRRGNENV